MHDHSSLSTPQAVIDEIDKLERRDRDAINRPSLAPMWGQLEGVPFVQIRGLAAFWGDDAGSELVQRQQDLLTGASGLAYGFQYLIIGQATETSFFMGLEGPSGEAVLRGILTALYPGIIMPGHSETHLGKALKDAGFFQNRGAMTGIPTRKGLSGTAASAHQSEGLQPSNVDQIERLIRGLQGNKWGLWVRVEPIKRSELIAQSHAVMDRSTALASLAKKQLQRVSQEMEQVNPTTQRGTTESVSGEFIDRNIEYAVNLLERSSDRLIRAKATSMWFAECQFFAADPTVAMRAGSLLRAIFAGPDSVPEPIRTCQMGPDGSSSSRLVTSLTTDEVATLTQLPADEFAGYRIAPYARFDTDLPIWSGKNPVILGQVIDGNRPTGASFSVPREDLSKHVLVAGMTGSGKTTTVKGILLRLHEVDVPFLVVEPAKSEYRDLLGSPGAEAESSGLISGLRVFTLGDETVAPFRLNPFEFEVIDLENRVHVQTHIDYLKAVFNAAFVLYAPMPYVLETCLHEIYTDCGWDLATGLNSRLDTEEYSNAAQLGSFPTLRDLYNKIDQVVDRLGYDQRIEMDVKAGLRARVGSLLLGSKGLMLNCRSGVPFADILSHPTVLELDRIGNDDEKAFLIGLVLTRLYEHRRVQFQAGTRAEFVHLTVIEEAHRLLKNVSTEVPLEGSNNRGQAVETFANMLSEIRAYGQGILVAEQIPTKLTPDVIKNSNLKLAHRLVSADDREAVGQSMNMKQEQMAFLSMLPPGLCAVHAEQADRPHLLKIENVVSGPRPAQIRDSDVRAAMLSITCLPNYEPVTGYWKNLYDGESKLNPSLHDTASELLDKRAFCELWSALMLRVIRDPTDNHGIQLAELKKLIQSVVGRLSDLRLQEVIQIVLVLGAAHTLEDRGRRYAWQFTQQDSMREHLTDGLTALLDGKHQDALHSLSRFVRQFRETTTIPVGPFAGCSACRARCWLRHDVEALYLEDRTLHDVADIIERSETLDQLHLDLVSFCKETVTERVGELPSADIRAISVCLLAQMVSKLGLTQSRQRRLVEGVTDVFD